MIHVTVKKMNYGQLHGSLKVQKHFAFFVNVFNKTCSVHAIITKITIA